MPAPKPWTDDPVALARAGRRVVAYRVAHGVERNQKRLPMTQEEFAARAGVSVGAVAAFEGGHRRTRVESLRRIAAACELSVGQLFAPDEPARLVSPHHGELTDEALLVGRIFDLAHTGTRAEILAAALEHLAQRTDPRAVTLREELEASGRLSSRKEGLGVAAGVGFPDFKNGSGK